MLQIQIQDDTLRSYLKQLDRKLDNLSAPMDKIGGVLENRVANRFETQTDPDGVAWEAWALSTFESYPWPGTKAAKKYRPGNAKVLDRYGHMLNSLNYQSDSNSVQVGFGAPYAIHHEYSTEKMPRRGLLTSDPETGTLAQDDETLALDIVQGFLDDALDK